MKSPLVVAFLTFVVIFLGAAMLMPLLHVKNQGAIAGNVVPAVAFIAAVIAFIVTPRRVK